MRLLLVVITALLNSAALGQSASLGDQLGVSAPGTAPASRLTVAVLDFENQTGDPGLGHWRYSPPVQLYEAKGVRLAPGSEYALRQLKKKAGDPLEVSEARKLGELIEARRVVWGSYQRAGKGWRATARVLNVATGKTSPELSAASADWFEIRDRLTDQVLKELGVTPTEAERAKMTRHHTTSSLALEWVVRVRAMRRETKAEGGIEKCARRAIQADPKYAEAQVCLAAVLGSQCKIEEAEQAAREAVKLEPDKASAHRVLGFVFLYQEKLTEAQEEAWEALRLDPDDEECARLLATVYDIQGSQMLALTYLNKAARLNPFEASIHAKLGRIYAAQLKREMAVAELTEAERLASPDDVNTEQFLAQGYMALNEAPSGIEHYEKFIALAKQQGLNPEVVKESEESLRLIKARLTPSYVTNPPPREYSEQSLDAELRQRLTREEFELGTNPLTRTPDMDRWAQELITGATNDVQKAQRLFETLSRHLDRRESGSRTAREVFADWNKPGVSFRCLEHTFLYVALARAAGLKAYCVFVIEDANGVKMPHACAGVLVGEQALLVDSAGRWFGAPHKHFALLNDVQAVAAYLVNCRDLRRVRLAAKLQPEWALVNFKLAFELVNEDRLDEARPILAKALNLEPNGWMANAARGQLAEKENRPKEAVRFYQKALEENPDFGQTRMRLAEIYLDQGRWLEARNECRLALRGWLLDDDAESVRRTLAMLNEKVGND